MLAIRLTLLKVLDITDCPKIEISVLTDRSDIQKKKHCLLFLDIPLRVPIVI